MKISSLFKYLKPYTAKSVIGALFKLFEAILELYMPMLLITVIDDGVAAGDKAYVIKMCFVLIGIVFVGLCCALVCQYLASKVSQGYGTTLRNAYFDKVMSLSRSQTAKFGEASLVNRATTDINNIQYFVAMLIRLVIRAPFLCVGGLVMAFIIDAKLALIVVAALPLFIIALAVIMKKSLPMHADVQKKLDSMASVMRENITGERVIRAFSRNNAEEKRFDASAAAHADSNYAVSKVVLPLNPITTLIMNIAIIAVLYVSGWEASSEIGVTTGEIVAFINYINQILAALVVVANLVITFSKSYVSACRLTEVMSLEPELSFDGGEQPADGSVSFSRVCFSYGGEKNVLTDISFDIPTGANIGIIGGTGSGKSTIVSLMLRFYDASSGLIKIGGKEIGSLSKNSLRSAISAVQQKIELISGSISDNIAFGSDISRDNIEKAAKAAMAYDFIKAKENGFDETVEQAGGNFSGGQKQRIAIARALARPCRILILDDSSSALDYATDAAVRRNIRELYKGTTVVSVSQRVGCIKNCDEIIVLDDGCVAGAGTHSELLASCAVYKEICASQGVTE